ncbi:MAG: hypothetical protein ACHQF2_05970 [Flavobacteriales bacterium]
MNIKSFLLTLLTFSVIIPGKAQDAIPEFMPKGQFYFYWGYNRSWYSKSDIKFFSDQARFTLFDVKATDRQSPLSFSDYVLNPTIPQFNIRLGYSVTKNLAVSFGYDHMKYVVTRGQTVKMTGQIAYTPENGAYAGCYDNADITIEPEFLRYEHTNGLNYLSADADYFLRMWRSKSGLFDVAFSSGYSLGFLYPRSDVDVFDVEGVNVFHMAGWGTAVSAGIKMKIGEHFFINWGNRGGFMHMPSVLCRENRFIAQQKFWFFETAFMVGYNFSFKKKS